MIKYEVCVETVEDVIAAEQGGADRVELCAAVALGGLTPSLGTLINAKATCQIPVFCIVRPRAGDFFYSAEELETILCDAYALKKAGADGLVFGALQNDGSIDPTFAEKFIEIARPLPVTFHRAFDVTPDPFKALDQLIALGVDRVLTSGQRGTALEGSELIKSLVEQANGRITVLAGAGVRAHNVAGLVKHSGVGEVHSTANASLHSSGTSEVGQSDLPEDFSTKPVRTCSRKVKAVVDTLKQL